MSGAPVLPRQLDEVAERDRELFGRVFLLSGLAHIGHDAGALSLDHPMQVNWDRRGRSVYQCELRCGAHEILTALADRAAWFAYAAAIGTLPHTVTSPYDKRALFAAHLSHVWLTTDIGADPVTALGWASAPAVNAT